MFSIGRKQYLSVLIGIILGFLLGVSITGESKKGSLDTSNPQLRQVVEEEEVCPIQADLSSPGAIISFLPVPIQPTSPTSEADNLIGQDFDPLALGSELAKLPSDNSPWTVEELDVDGDFEPEEIYYGNTAMNHTPHVVYVIDDGKIIFFASGNSVHVEQSLGGFLLNETLDWIAGKHKTTKYSYNNGEIKPEWYQISCTIRTEES